MCWPNSRSLVRRATPGNPIRWYRQRRPFTRITDNPGYTVLHFHAAYELENAALLRQSLPSVSTRRGASPSYSSGEQQDWTPAYHAAQESH